MKSEKQIENYLKKKITEAGGLCLKWVSPGTAGAPDRIIIMPKDHIYFIELKAEDRKNNLSAVQKVFMRKLVSLGCNTRVISSYDEVNQFIEEVITNEVYTT